MYPPQGAGLTYTPTMLLPTKVGIKPRSGNEHRKQNGQYSLNMPRRQSLGTAPATEGCTPFGIVPS